MSMRAFEELHETLCGYVDEIARKGELSVGDLDSADKLTSTIKNILEIFCMREEGGYSEDGGMYGGGYSRGRGGNNYDDYSNAGGSASYANRGQHYVRGHYSSDGGNMGGGYSGRRGSGQRRDARGRYSRDDGTEHMVNQLEQMMGDVSDPRIQQAFQRFIQQIEED